MSTVEPVPADVHDPDVPINVALLVDNDYLYRFRSVFSHMLVGLVDQPTNVTLVCPNPIVASTLPIGPATIIEFKIPFWPWQYQRNLRILAAELKRAKINLIHSCSGRSCWLAIDLARILSIPYVITFNGLFQEECYLRVDHDYCGRLIGISEPICQTLRELYGKAGDKIERIRPGCFLRPRRPAGDRPRTLLSVGEFRRHSGYETLLRALAELQRRGHELLTIILGRGPMEHSYHHWVNTHGLGKSVIFLEVLANWDEALRDVDFYVQPGPFYSLHSGPYEALAHGCPLITTTDTALDLVIPRQTGLTFKTDDDRALADLLTDWLRGTIDAQTLSANALEFARTELSLAKSIERQIACYRSILTDSAGRTAVPTRREPAANRF